jgi:hypothetical protein
MSTQPPDDAERAKAQTETPPAAGFGGEPPAAFHGGTVVPVRPPQVGVADVFIPTNPLAAISCWLGVFSLVSCWLGVLLGPLAIGLGVVSLKKGKLIEQSTYGKTTSTVRSWVGIVTGIISFLIGVGFLVLKAVK